MKTHLKFSGVKAELPPLKSDELQSWSFDFRPGGWIVATREHLGQIERRRFYYHRRQDRFYAKFIKTGAMDAHKASATDFFGQKVDATRAGSPVSTLNDFTTQFPGKVTKILVKEGDTVAAGVPLLMIEAMKMEFAIKSETRGKIKKLLVQEGQQLTPGQKLIDFETEKTEAKK